MDKEQTISEKALKALRQNRKIFCPFCREYEKTFISKVSIGFIEECLNCGEKTAMSTQDYENIFNITVEEK